MRQTTGNACGSLEQIGNAKVSEHWFSHAMAGGATFVKQDIGRFDIAMDDAMLMDIVNSNTDRGKKVHDVNGRGKLSQVRGSSNVVSQCRSSCVVHDHIGDSTFCL